jgi:hypothetical protein
MNYVDEEMIADQMSFDLEDLKFDDESYDELDLVDEHVCSRCGAEFDAADVLEHIRTHGVCQSCLSELMLEAAEDAMGM